jgi:hypothetical protein
MNKIHRDGVQFKGEVEKQLFSAEGWAEIEKAINNGATKEELQVLKKIHAKPLFQDNKVWKFLKDVFGIDAKIPFITGKWTTDPIVHNTITTKGLEIAVDQIGGTETTPVTAIAIGIGTPSSTALGSEIASGGGSRGAATVTNITVSTTNDTEQWQKTFTFSGSFAITEEGLFDNNTSGGNMFASQSFSAINVVSGDTLQVTHKVTAS